MNIITHLQMRLESILDNHDLDHPSEEILQAKKNFEALTDPRLLRGLSESLPDDTTDKAVILFSRLALYFDAGVFLELDSPKWEPQAHFHRGQVTVLKGHQKHIISLPSVELMSILRTDAKPVLKKLHLQSLDADHKTVCLLLRPAQDFAFLLFSSLPDLWLREHTRLVTEAIHHGLYNE
jgi:hypothetical protein